MPPGILYLQETCNFCELLEVGGGKDRRDGLYNNNIVIVLYAAAVVWPEHAILDGRRFVMLSLLRMLGGACFVPSCVSGAQFFVQIDTDLETLLIDNCT